MSIINSAGNAGLTQGLFTKADATTLSKEQQEQLKKLQDSLAGPAANPSQASSSIQVKVTQSAAELERDRSRAEGRVATPQTQVAAQSPGTEASDISEAASAGESAVDKFLSFTEKSWSEKVRALILSGLGVTEEQMQNMSVEEREKIEAKIREKIQQEIEKKTGMLGSASAAADLTG